MTACPVNESGKYADGLWPNTPRPGTPERARGTQTPESCSRTPGVKSTDSKGKSFYLTTETIDLWPVMFAPAFGLILCFGSIIKMHTAIGSECPS